ASVGSASGSFPEKLHRLQRRADRRPPRTLLCEAGRETPRAAADRACRTILRGDEGRHPPRRPTGLLFAGGGFHQEVLHHFVLWVVFWVLAAIWLSTQRGVL